MFCREVKSSITPYLDGRLDSRQTRRLEEHIASCVSCRSRLNLMEEIPVVLQTDRMLAPHPTFTKIVMQQIIVRQQISSTQSGFRASQTRFQTIATTNHKSDGGQEADLTNNKVILLADRQASQTRTPSGYVLRFSALAAVMVVMMTAGVYALTQSPTDLPDSTAAVYLAIQGFADTVRNAFSSPFELLAGVVISALVLVGLWYYLARPQRDRS